jgi:hypothetical protein
MQGPAASRRGQRAVLAGLSFTFLAAPGSVRWAVATQIDVLAPLLGDPDEVRATLVRSVGELINKYDRAA